ncbi:MAG: ParA family protein [Candidatus Saccharibacteria bacterium]
MTHVIAVVNQKGGVGKTTSTINLGAQLAKNGYKVLIVDADPQGNATSGLGLFGDSFESTTYDILVSNQTIDKVVQETYIPNLYIIPANPNLAGAEIDLSTMLNREFKLKESLSSCTHDFILIDCPPALGLLSINALTASNLVLIPVQAEYYALEGLSQLLNVIQRVKEGINAKLEILGVFITMYDKRTSLSEQVLSELKKHFGDKVFDAIIPRNIRLAEAPSFGKAIFDHDKWSKGARAYKQLAKEVMERVGTK